MREYYYEIFKVIREIVNYDVKIKKLFSHQSFINTLEVTLFSRVDYRKWEKFPTIIFEIADRINTIELLIQHV